MRCVLHCWAVNLFAILTETQRDTNTRLLCLWIRYGDGGHYSWNAPLLLVCQGHAWCVPASCRYLVLPAGDLPVVASWKVMAHAQKPDFFFRRNGRVHLNRRGRQFSRLLAAEVCASAFIVGSNAGYTMFRSSENCTIYPLHSPVSPSLPLPCVTVCHHISAGV